jgi:hypothetical protein
MRQTGRHTSKACLAIMIGIKDTLGVAARGAKHLQKHCFTHILLAFHAVCCLLCLTFPPLPVQPYQTLVDSPCLPAFDALPRGAQAAIMWGSARKVMKADKYRQGDSQAMTG